MFSEANSNLGWGRVLSLYFLYSQRDWEQKPDVRCSQSAPTSILSLPRSTDKRWPTNITLPQTKLNALNAAAILNWIILCKPCLLWWGQIGRSFRKASPSILLKKLMSYLYQMLLSPLEVNQSLLERTQSFSFDLARGCCNWRSQHTFWVSIAETYMVSHYFLYY